MKWNEHQDKYDTQMMEAEKEILRWVIDSN
jgi:hypothetical protein